MARPSLIERAHLRRVAAAEDADTRRERRRLAEGELVAHESHEAAERRCIRINSVLSYVYAEVDAQR